MMNKHFCFSSLVKTLKKTTRNISISDEEFLRSFVEGYIEFGRIKDRKGNPVDFDKARTSRLMNNKEDIPSAFRRVLEVEGVEEGLIDSMAYFVENTLDKNKEGQTRANVVDLINNANNIDSSCKKQLLEKQNEILHLIVAALLEAIKIDNRIGQEKLKIWKENQNEFCLICGDITKYWFPRKSKEKRIVVIPVETSFQTQISTTISDNPFPLVSENTLHGKWIAAWKHGQNTVEDLNSRIHKSLIAQGIDSSNGKFPIGTISIVEKGNTKFFLTAISEFDEYNMAHSNQDNIAKAIMNILKTYDRSGQGYSLYMSLIGTGRSRTKMKTIEAWMLIKEIVLSNSECIQGNINMVVLQDAFEEICRTELEVCRNV